MLVLWDACAFSGVVRHVGDSLGDTLVQARNHIVTLGIAPWGVVYKRNDLIGRDVRVFPAFHAFSLHVWMYCVYQYNLNASYQIEYLMGS